MELFQCILSFGRLVCGIHIDKSIQTGGFSEIKLRFDNYHKLLVKVLREKRANVSDGSGVSKVGRGDEGVDGRSSIANWGKRSSEIACFSELLFELGE